MKMKPKIEVFCDYKLEDLDWEISIWFRYPDDRRVITFFCEQDLELEHDEQREAILILLNGIANEVNRAS